MMRVLGLDPSSTRTGYALLTGLAAADLADAGYLDPPRRQAPALERIRALCDELPDLVRELAPDRIAIEIPSGHVGRGRHRGGGAGLSVYGFAAGAQWQVLRRLCAEGAIELSAPNENEWSGSTPKPRRMRQIAALYPTYAHALAGRRDSGGDVGDAIGIARWLQGEGNLSRQNGR